MAGTLGCGGGPPDSFFSAPLLGGGGIPLLKPGFLNKPSASGLRISERSCCDKVLSESQEFPDADRV